MTKSATPLAMEQYEIWWVDLDPVKGSETKKKRPCVILSANVINRHSQRVIVVPLLKQHKPWPYAVNIFPSTLNGVDTERRADLTQIRCVDKSRISNRQGILENEYARPLREAAKIVLSL